MVHLYCGEGKGKTTAAMGLALRMAGRGKRVVVAQFLKGADSGERLARTLGAQPDCGLLVLDEVCAAVNTGLLPLEEVISCLDRAAGEVVLTGRDPDPALVGRADYITEMGKLRHPFDLGTAARPGVEY